MFINFAANCQHYLETSSCPEQEGLQTYFHPEHCDHYIKCANGSLSIEQCENGLLYDGKGNVHEHCNYHWDVDCGQRKADGKQKTKLFNDYNCI